VSERRRRRVAAGLVACVLLLAATGLAFQRRARHRPFVRIPPSGRGSSLSLADHGRLLVVGCAPREVWSLENGAATFLREIAEPIEGRVASDADILYVEDRRDPRRARAVALRTGLTLSEFDLPPHDGVADMSPSGRLVALSKMRRVELRELGTGKVVDTLEVPWPRDTQSFVVWAREDVLICGFYEADITRFFLTLADRRWHGPVVGAFPPGFEIVSNAGERVRFAQTDFKGRWLRRVLIDDLDGRTKREVTLASRREDLDPLELAGALAFVLPDQRPRSELEVYNVTTGRRVDTLVVSGSLAGNLAVTESGDRVAAMLEDGSVAVWDVELPE
jgi:hypothetical protein